MLRSLLASLALMFPAAHAAEEWIPLWPGEAPGAKRPAPGSETINASGHITNVEVPQYQLYLPAEGAATRAAVVILPGGGYTIVSSNSEGHEFGRWLAERGIAGIVVKYRVSGDDAFGYGFPVPFLDARRAIRTVRANAEKWNIDPDKIGVMGFSAGGHLASLCATRFADRFAEETADEIDRQDCRPDFAALIYPVISLDPEISHGGSRRRLLGAQPDAAQVAHCSTELAVSGTTPPVFLLGTYDDFVDVRNSLRFADACKRHGVPVTLHVFEQGGHGYGLHAKGNLADWPGLFEKWLREKGQ